MTRVVKFLAAISNVLLLVVLSFVGNALILIAVVVAVPLWIVTAVPLWLVGRATQRRFPLTLPAFMAYAAQIPTAVISRTILRRFHADNLEEWPWNEPPRPLRHYLS